MAGDLVHAELWQRWGPEKGHDDSTHVQKPRIKHFPGITSYWGAEVCILSGFESTDVKVRFENESSLFAKLHRLCHLFDNQRVTTSANKATQNISAKESTYESTKVGYCWQKTEQEA